MVVITKLKWQIDRVIYITTKHGITPGEVEDVCFGSPLILRGSGKRKKRLYYVLGQTKSDRYLSIIVKPLPKQIALPITAREMTSAERKRYKR